VLQRDQRCHVGGTHEQHQRQHQRREADALSDGGPLFGAQPADHGGQLQAHQQEDAALQDERHRPPVLGVRDPMPRRQAAQRALTGDQTGDDGRHQPGRVQLLHGHRGDERGGEGEDGADRCVAHA
jgi:hypothetical protein